MTKINDVIRYWSDISHTIHFCDVTGQFIITSSIAMKMANLMWCFVVKIRTFKKFVCQRFLPDSSHKYKQVVNLLMTKMSVLIFLPLSKFFPRGPWATACSPRDIATADMQMLCNIYSILSSQLMKGSSFNQFLVLKKNIYGHDSQWSVIIWTNSQWHFNSKSNVKFGGNWLSEFWRLMIL